MGLTKILKVLLALGAIVAVVSMSSLFMQAELLKHESISKAEAEANDSREQMIGFIQVGLYLLTAIFFGCWIVRANKNVRALGADGLRITPGWAVGYFFIPMANLWRPYQAMKDLWLASHNPSSWSTALIGIIVPIWWTLWLLSIFSGQIAFRMTLHAITLDQIKSCANVQLITEFIEILLCLVAIALVSQIAAAQTSHHRNALASLDSGMCDG